MIRFIFYAHLFPVKITKIYKKIWMMYKKYKDLTSNTIFS